ncbi:MAG: exonuclease domain-containing protein [Candidatus Gracilibacteria bacterium]|nr:exonuclease domain-containing protein [Candidatus Gracilibacteria bacterium]MDD2908170.1 exonuclease domain-containing protein [Candidatus Gracilibacteria bacterium]
MNITFIDTETTGIKEEDVIIQLGLINEIDWKIIHEINSFFSNGDRKISLVSKATHNILEENVKDFPVFSVEVEEYKLIEQIKDNTVFIGHNVQFDIGMLAKFGFQTTRYIDTLNVAKHLLQDEQDEFENSYRQEVLKYYLMEKGITFPTVRAHDAMADVLILRVNFKYLFDLAKAKFSLNSDDETVEKLVELTQSPVFLKKLNFGKYKGTTFDDLLKNDPSYLKWLAKNTDDENVRFTCSKYL